MTAVDVRTPTPAAATERPRPARGALRVLTGATHLTLLLLLAQAVLAGVFVSDTYRHAGGGDAWVSAHGVVADVLWVVALVGAVTAAVQLRRAAPALALAAAAYLVLALIETGIGHLISEPSVLGISGQRDQLIALHIPLAVVLVALGGWIAVRASRLARA